MRAATIVEAIVTRVELELDLVLGNGEWSRLPLSSQAGKLQPECRNYPSYAMGLQSRFN